MSLFSKWKAIEDHKRLALKYGENSKVAARHTPSRKSTTPHSFPHLLNVKFTVPKPNWQVVDPPTYRTNPYPITPGDLLKIAKRSKALALAKLEGGVLDNDIAEL